MKRLKLSLVVVIVVLIVLLAFGTRLYQVVPPGHVAVATLFGDVRPTPYEEGLHVPVNPLYDWYMFDVREKSHKETANVPSQDQLQTQVDVSVQYRLRREDAPRVLKETGTASDVLDVHLVPKLRSVLREQGKSIRRAEDFFLERTQDMLQGALLEGLRSYLAPKGVEIQAVLIRDITLPPFIIKAIEGKKEREQAVEKQKAELERFRTEQQQKIAAAQAEREAAEEQAARRRVLADAQAYEIERINQAIGDNPSYVRLQALKSLESIAKDPAAKLYFLDGSSPMPLPLMHMGEPMTPLR
ncbi:MAG: prohibitin family protein [Gammaproteobacteria bacterium]|nr:prohibitin family protein [Gammaproteobacteria bacterium]